MTLDLALDGVLAALALMVAGWVISVRDAFTAVVGFVAAGLLVTLIWVRLEAVDVALIEAAVGSGVTGTLLLSAVSRNKPGAAALPAPRPLLCFAIGVLCVLVSTSLAAVVLLLPDPAPTLAPQAAASAAATGLGNPVTNVLMAFRAMDTLLEKVVLLIALAAIFSLSSEPFWSADGRANRHVAAQGALRFFAKVLPPVGLVVGIYMLWVSADHPGGAFQGGTILAVMWVLLMMAGEAPTPSLQSATTRLFVVVGPVVFLVVGLAGIWLAGAFLAYPAACAKPLIVSIELGMVLTIAVTIGLIIAGAPRRPSP